jgi:hypothetical protein
MARLTVAVERLLGERGYTRLNKIAMKTHSNLTDLGGGWVELEGSEKSITRAARAIRQSEFREFSAVTSVLPDTMSIRW